MNSNTITPAVANFRGSEAFKKATRHSGRVRLYKILLPVFSISLAVIFVGSAFMAYTPFVQLEISGLGLDSGNLVMQNPKMSGVDKNNRPYSMNAIKAVQNLSKPDIIQLQKINATLPMDGKSSALVTAESGVYDSKNETMRLVENVEIKGARGMDISMQEADIDIKTGELISKMPVTVNSADTDISSDMLVVEDNGASIIFKKRVKMIIKKPKSRGVAPTNASQF